MSGVARTVFAGMLREEWRLHSRLFGGARFAGFPLLVAAIAAGATRLLTTTGTDVGAIVAGLHALVLVFGLHTGSIGFVGRDAIRNLLGELTLLVFSSRTLPVSPRRLVAIFLLKDVVYYAALFLLPLSVAVAAVGGGATLGRLPLLWVTTTATFVLGVLATFALVALSTTLSGAIVGVAVGGLLVGGFLLGVDLVSLTPYGFYRAPSTGAAARALLPMAVLAGVGFWAYDPIRRTPARTVEARFARWRDRLGDDDGLLTRSLLDVTRSSGGVWKVLFSGGVLFAVTAFLVGVVSRLTGVEPSTGISFGALLGLTAFTTYNWLTQFDDVESYRGLPVSVAAVFRAKGRAFLVLGVPTVLAYYVLAAAVYGGPAVELLVGAVLALGVLGYLFGLTVWLAGLDPNEFLFDSLLFAAFAGAVSVGLVPVLVVGFVLAPLGPGLLVGVAAWGLVLGGAGVGVYRRALSRWTVRYRRG